MNTKKGEKKLKNVNNAKNIPQAKEHRIVDNVGVVINNNFTIFICLKPEDDLPHPRHLCFAYPFGKSSPKKHCIKCYCYVCEKIAPCKNWSKTPKRHCDATEKDDKWKLEKKLNNKIPGSTTMVYHKLTVTSSYDPASIRLDKPPEGFGGALICNNDGEWDSGISMQLCNPVDATDISVPFYIVLLEALQLAWSRGLRCLEVKLGFVFHDGFWFDFTRDAVTRKFSLCVNPYSKAMILLKQVEDYLNREWFICVKNTELFEEEMGALTVALLGDCQDVATKNVCDFRKHPFNTERLTTEFRSIIHETASEIFDSKRVQYLVVSFAQQLIMSF